MASNNNSESVTLGVVSYLNARPLIEGLDAEAGVSLHFAVPSALPAMLREGSVDAALIPVIDLARYAGLWERVSDACIASDGETLTVRVYSRVPPAHLNVLYVDDDSHTSIALAQLIWLYVYDRRVVFKPLSSASGLDDCEAVLLIGDKVVTAPLEGFEHEVDLGGAWKAWTGLPFVFAVWAAPPAARCGTGGSPVSRLAELLESARDRGVANAATIAAEQGPALGWPVELAREYLTERLKYTITPRAEEGLRRFIDYAADEGIVPRPGALVP